MTAAITLDELFHWNDETSRFWKAHLDAHPDLLQPPAGSAETLMCRPSSVTFGAWSSVGPSALLTYPKHPKKPCPPAPQFAFRSAPAGGRDQQKSVGRSGRGLGSSLHAHRSINPAREANCVPPQSHGARALPQPTPLGTARHARPRRRLPFRLQWRSAL
jgi:hypothetical protein